jgi:hypothetical protein
MNQLDILTNILGALFIFAIIYFFGKRNSYESVKEIEKLITNFHLDFYKISNKNCSVERLTREFQIEIKDTSYFFDSCDIYIENDFTLIQGFRESLFKSAIRGFIITKDIEKVQNKFKNWTVLKPKLVEINPNKTQIKIVYTAKTNKSDYSLIICNLKIEDYDSIMQIKNYC